MKSTISTLLTAALFTVGLQSTQAGTQPLVAQTGIVAPSTNLRTTSAVTLGAVVINAPGPGRVLVRFDGTCVSDSGDRIIVAASNTHNWDVNSGNNGFQSGSITNRRSFSHSRMYTVAAGVDSFFAVAQNYVETGGSGVASIYGSLTAEFFPDAGAARLVDTSVYYNGNLRGSVVTLGAASVIAPAPGKIISHFDGYMNADPGDRMVLATSNTTSWGINDGNVNTQSISATNNKTPFSHTRAYTAGVGANTCYAVGQNYVQTAGSGAGYTYGNLSVEYFPTGGAVIADMHGIATGSVNLRPADVAIDSITINAPSAGKVLVQFDGLAVADQGDRIVLAASNSRNWAVDDGNVGVLVNDASNNYASFSHSRLYTAAAGSHTYYAVARNYVNTAGSGNAYIYGSLVVKYFPDVATGIDNVTATSNSFDMYPNPAMDKVLVRTEGNEHNTIELMDMNGRTIVSQQSAGTETVLNIAQLEAGIYLVRVNDLVKKLVKQ
jgi:hypothetical protein